MQTLTVEKQSAVVVKRRREHLFYTGMTVVFVLVVFAGFARTYYLKPYFSTPQLTPLLQLHGLIFTSWILLLLAQTVLVAAKRTAVHMLLGWAGACIAVLMIVVGTTTAVIRAKLVEVPPGSDSPLVFLTIPLGDMLVFALLVAAGFYYRRRIDVHKRLMLLATITLLPAAVARIPSDFFLQGGPLVFFGLPDLFILVILIYDLFTRGRPHRATVWGGLLLVVSHPLRFVVGNTQAWLSFATWLTDRVS